MVHEIAVEVLIDHEKCTLCKLCVELCPAGVFNLDNNRINVFSDRCIECYGCIPLCPVKAISIKIPRDESLYRFTEKHG